MQRVLYDDCGDVPVAVRHASAMFYIDEWRQCIYYTSGEGIGRLGLFDVESK